MSIAASPRSDNLYTTTDSDEYKDFMTDKDTTTGKDPDRLKD